MVSIVEKNEFQNRVFLFSSFLGAAILNNCDVSWLPIDNELLSYNKRATISRHNYSRWRRAGNLKTKIRDSQIRFSPL